MISNHWLIQRLSGFGDAPALIWRDRTISYRDLLAGVDEWIERLDRWTFSGAVRSVGLAGDYSPESVALLLALVARGMVAVPISPTVADRDRLFDVAAVSVWADLSGDKIKGLSARSPPAPHPLLEQLANTRSPGLVLFSSGSTGASKGILHNFEQLLTRFREQRAPIRAMTFLLLDHIGGINTLFSILASGGIAASVGQRTPETVCEAVQNHRLEVLPVTPTFLNMFLMSNAFSRFDLSSLRLITYGTEPMPQNTLDELHKALPHVKLKQTYGLSELAIFSTQSRGPGSLWMKIGGDGTELKVVDGQLWVKSRSPMLGYLNAPSPFDSEGWFNTQDLVEQDGEWFKVLGRKSELINVAGEKVYPAEVENVLLQLPNVRDVTVWGKKSPVTGAIVAATITLEHPETAEKLKNRLTEFCAARLPRFKIPVLIEIATEAQYNERFKKLRRR